MKRCEYCDRRIREHQDFCPICIIHKNLKHGAQAANYPVYGKNPAPRRSCRRWVILSMLLLTLAALIVNISAGGCTWSLYAVLGMYINYQVFLSRKLIEASIIQKFLAVVISVCFLLAIIQIVSNSQMAAAQFIIPIVLYAALLVCGVIYFSDFQFQKSHIVPILFIIGLSLAAMTVSFLIFRIINWPTIVLICTTILICMVTLLFFRKPVIAEIRKKIHT